MLAVKVAVDSINGFDGKETSNEWEVKVYSFKALMFRLTKRLRTPGLFPYGCLNWKAVPLIIWTATARDDRRRRR